MYITSTKMQEKYKKLLISHTVIVLATSSTLHPPLSLFIFALGYIPKGYKLLQEFIGLTYFKTLFMCLVNKYLHTVCYYEGGVQNNGGK